MGGMVLMEGVHNLGTQINDNIQYVMVNQVPNQVIQHATPYVRKMRMRADLALYAQDRWTIKRLTLKVSFGRYVFPETIVLTAATF